MRDTRYEVRPPFQQTTLDWPSIGLAVLAHLAVAALAWITSSPIRVGVSDPQPIMASIIGPTETNPPLQPAPMPAALPAPSQQPIARQDKPKTPPPLISPVTKPEPARQTLPVQAESLPSAAPSEPLERSPRSTALAAPAAAEKIASAAAEISQPRFDVDTLENPKPGYPALSRRLGEEGQVLLRVLVSETGRPEQIQLLQTSGFERLDTAAQVAVQRWRFTPARKGNNPVAAWVQVPISFQLRR